MAHYRAPRADSDLDDIWLYLASESGSVDVANRVVDSITDQFFLLSRHPHMGRLRDEFGAGSRTFTVGEYVIVYTVEDRDVLILRVVHGRRDIESIFED